MAERNKAYAAALFALAEASGQEGSVCDELKELTALLDQFPDYSALLSSPAVPKSERLALVRQAFDGRFLPDLVSFLLLLCDGGAFGEVVSCAEEYEALYRAKLRKTTAYVVSAVPLTEEEKTRLRSRFEGMTGRTVTLVCSVDERLLGGVVVELDGTVYDGSLRRRMEELKKVMDE